MKSGRWMKLAVALGNPGTSLKRGPWCVRVEGPTEVGEPVAVAKSDGTKSVRYVATVVRQAAASWESSIVLVAAMPPEEAPEPTGSPGPHSRAAAPIRKSLRECEDCGERCRPGAGRCDECRAQGSVPAAPAKA